MSILGDFDEIDRSITLDRLDNLIWQYFQKQYVAAAWDRLIDLFRSIDRSYSFQLQKAHGDNSWDRSIPFRETSMHLWWPAVEIDRSISLDRSIDHFSSWTFGFSNSSAHFPKAQLWFGRPSKGIMSIFSRNLRSWGVFSYI